MTNAASSEASARSRTIAYWVITGIIATEFAFGGVMEVLRIPLLFEILRHLGYPGYFSMILGVWKLLGVVAVLVPGFAPQGVGLRGHVLQHDGSGCLPFRDW